MIDEQTIECREGCYTYWRIQYDPKDKERAITVWTDDQHPDDEPETVDGDEATERAYELIHYYRRLRYYWDLKENPAKDDEPILECEPAMENPIYDLSEHVRKPLAPVQ